MTQGTNVAIACQGGGSHTAFTAGVLQALLPAIEASDRRLVGLSGASGGALAAVGGWYGHLAAERTAPEVLDDLWAALAADGWADAWWNDWLVGVAHAENNGAPIPWLTPSQTPAADVGRRRLRRALTDAVDFDAVADLAGPDAPRLVVGAVNVTAGTFETFNDGEVTPEAVLASCALPQLFESVEIDGDEYWDGLFSQNPPIYDLLRGPVADRPEELWVVQVNPQRRDGAPTTAEAIADRRNELAGNLALNQELRLVEAINEFLDEGYLPADRFVRTDVKRLQFDRKLPHSSKLDRDAEFVADLLAAGRERGAAFLEERA